MAYLSEKAFVHRDLAARNILLDEALASKVYVILSKLLTLEKCRVE
jgi:aminoglycoside/choline kinase family phosphotransferase